MLSGNGKGAAANDAPRNQHLTQNRTAKHPSDQSGPSMPSRPERLVGRIWRDAAAIDGTWGETFLARRGVTDELDADLVRFAWRCPRGAGTAAALVALLRGADGGQPVGLHATYITRAGEVARAWPDDPAQVEIGRPGFAMLTPYQEVCGRLAITGDPVDALQLLDAGEPAVWAASSPDAVAKLPPMLGVADLVLCLPDDREWLDAGRICAGRWADQGATVRIERRRHEPKRA